MTWFAASIIVGMKRCDGKGSISVLENVILLEADSITAAQHAAFERGKLEASDDDGLTINGKPAEYIFAGVRKVVTISNPAPLDSAEDRPTSGSEITFSEFEVPDETVLHRLGQGKTVEIIYVGNPK